MQLVQPEDLPEVAVRVGEAAGVAGLRGPRPQVRFTSMATGVVRGQGGIRRVIDDTGEVVDAGVPDHVDGMTAVTRLASFPLP